MCFHYLLFRHFLFFCTHSLMDCLCELHFCFWTTLKKRWYTARGLTWYNEWPLTLVFDKPFWSDQGLNKTLCTKVTTFLNHSLCFHQNVRKSCLSSYTYWTSVDSFVSIQFIPLSVYFSLKRWESCSCLFFMWWSGFIGKMTVLYTFTACWLQVLLLPMFKLLLTKLPITESI